MCVCICTCALSQNNTTVSKVSSSFITFKNVFFSLFFSFRQVMLAVCVSCLVCVCLPVLDVDEYLCFPCDRICLVVAGANV